MPPLKRRPTFSKHEIRMLSFFRRLSNSWIGASVMVLILLMILAGFAMQDVRSVFSGNFGMGAGTLAKVGDQPVTDRALSSTMRRELDRARQENPEATYASLAGQFSAILDSLIDERALLAFAEDHGFILSKRLVDAEIAKLPDPRSRRQVQRTSLSSLPAAAAD